MKRKKVIGASLLALGLVTAGGVAAHADANPMANRQSEMSQAIAKRFGLNQSDVETFFAEQRQTFEAVRKQEESNKLQALVTSGKLNQDQVNKIVAKRAEMQAQMDAKMKSQVQGTKKTPEQMKSEMKAKTAELKKWATENNIPIEYLMPKGPGGLHKGFGPHNK